MSLWSRLFAPRVVYREVRTSTRPMTEKDWARFNAAFDRMDDAFRELRGIGEQ